MINASRDKKNQHLIYIFCGAGMRLYIIFEIANHQVKLRSDE